LEREERVVPGAVPDQTEVLLHLIAYHLPAAAAALGQVMEEQVDLVVEVQDLVQLIVGVRGLLEKETTEDKEMRQVGADFLVPGHTRAVEVEQVKQVLREYLS
jgi:hypothetical protein